MWIYVFPSMSTIPDLSSRPQHQLNRTAVRQPADSGRGQCREIRLGGGARGRRDDEDMKQLCLKIANLKKEKGGGGGGGGGESDVGK